MQSNHIKNKLRNTLKDVLPKNRWWRRLAIATIIVVLVAVGGMYGIARWYIHSEKGKQQLGVSFIPDYAESLGVDPQQTMDALTGIGVKQFRLVSYWSDMERTPGHYDFSQLDWQFKKAKAANAKVLLTVGLRQPRWPECHMPDWAAKEPMSQWQPQLEQFMQAVIQRYQHSPSLQAYQLENEYFLKGFGTCTDFSRSRLVSEYNLVKKLDPHRTIIVGRSNNALGFPVGQPQPDEFSISVYKRVWDGNFSHRYLEYPQPAWFYAYIAGAQKIFTGRDMIIGELQAEAWPPRGKTIQQTSLAEQNKSFNADRFKARVQYGKATGMPQIYLWGAEYWYYRSTVLHDPSVWNVAKQEFKN
ncbi:MAG TPA: beta-galactosidase [Verrucomicrobiae bacterium]|nr:beta-galactosidase [Verrucomicrobiae bacterium]